MDSGKRKAPAKDDEAVAKVTDLVEQMAGKRADYDKKVDQVHFLFMFSNFLTL